MRLYHGSLEIVERPEIRQSTRTLDFGNGFYTTTSESQAKEWVVRRCKSQQVRRGYVNVYNFDEQKAENLQVLNFDSPNNDWIDFVMSNRMRKSFIHDYDIVKGPVANDRVYAAFSLFEDGFLSRVQLIEELRTYNLVDQVLFHTEQSLETICFFNAKLVEI